MKKKRFFVQALKIFFHLPIDQLTLKKNCYCNFILVLWIGEYSILSILIIQHNNTAKSFKFQIQKKRIFFIFFSPIEMFLIELDSKNPVV